MSDVIPPTDEQRARILALLRAGKPTRIEAIERYVFPLEDYPTWYSGTDDPTAGPRRKEPAND